MRSDSLSAPVPEENEESVHQLLLNAHLLKIRGELESAAAECIKALRINPDSIEAHTLLGDVYTSQGKTEDAIRWYKLALDISPESRKSQDRLDEILPPRRALGRFGFPIPKLNLVTLIAATVLILLVVLIAVVLNRPQPSARDQLAPFSTSTPAPSNPSVAPVTTVTPGSSATRQVTEPRIDERSQPSQTPAASDAESQAINQLNSSNALSNLGLRVTDFSLDPRDSGATVTFISATGKDTLNSQAVVREGYAVLRELFAQNDALTAATVRVLYRSTTNSKTSLDLVFTGDMTKQKNSQLNPETSSYQDLLAAFDNTWFRDDLK